MSDVASGSANPPAPARPLSAAVAERRWQLAIRLEGIAVIWSVGLVLAAALVPAYGTTSTSSVNGVTISSTTLVQSQGAWAMVLATIPALVSVTVVAAMLHRHRRNARWSGPVAWTAIGLLTIESLLGILSVGAFLLPAAILLALAVRVVPAGEPETG
jgi:hypothetical protein